MSFVVKSTMNWQVLDLLCPHYCRGCGLLGSVCCERCKKDILVSNLNFGAKCPAIKNLVAVGYREGLLGALVKEYKYGPVRAIGPVLAELLDAVVPELKGRVVVVPLPTIGRHVRARGFDHTRLLARRLVRRRDWECQELLEREAETVQVGTDRATRLTQAQQAYRLKEMGKLDAKTTYVLLDDVWTTGASMRAAEQLLKQAGAKKLRRVTVAVSR